MRYKDFEDWYLKTFLKKETIHRFPQIATVAKYEVYEALKTRVMKKE